MYGKVRCQHKLSSSSPSELLATSVSYWGLAHAIFHTVGELRFLVFFFSEFRLVGSQAARLCSRYEYVVASICVSPYYPLAWLKLCLAICLALPSTNTSNVGVYESNFAQLLIRSSTILARASCIFYFLIFQCDYADPFSPRRVSDMSQLKNDIPYVWCINNNFKKRLNTRSTRKLLRNIKRRHDPTKKIMPAARRNT